MAILRPREIRQMSANEQGEKIRDLELELAENKGQIEIGGFPENVGRIKELRRTIARIKTIQKEEQ